VLDLPSPLPSLARSCARFKRLHRRHHVRRRREVDQLRLMDSHIVEIRVLHALVVDDSFPICRLFTKMLLYILAPCWLSLITLITHKR
jgi:hypothetical protein